MGTDSDFQKSDTYKKERLATSSNTVHIVRCKIVSRDYDFEMSVIHVYPCVVAGSISIHFRVKNWALVI